MKPRPLKAVKFDARGTSAMKVGSKHRKPVTMNERHTVGVARWIGCGWSRPGLRQRSH